MEEKDIQDLEYVLKFALQVIEDNGLDNKLSKENWFLGHSLEEQIEKIQKLNNES